MDLPPEMPHVPASPPPAATEKESSYSLGSDSDKEDIAGLGKGLGNEDDVEAENDDDSDEEDYEDYEDYEKQDTRNTKAGSEEDLEEDREHSEDETPMSVQESSIESYYGQDDDFEDDFEEEGEEEEDQGNKGGAGEDIKDIEVEAESSSNSISENEDLPLEEESVTFDGDQTKEDETHAPAVHAGVSDEKHVHFDPKAVVVQEDDQKELVSLLGSDNSSEEPKSSGSGTLPPAEPNTLKIDDEEGDFGSESEFSMRDKEPLTPRSQSDLEISEDYSMDEHDSIHESPQHSNGLLFERYSPVEDEEQTEKSCDDHAEGVTSQTSNIASADVDSEEDFAESTGHGNEMEESVQEFHNNLAGQFVDVPYEGLDEDVRSLGQGIQVVTESSVSQQVSQLQNHDEYVNSATFDDGNEETDQQSTDGSEHPSDGLMYIEESQSVDACSHSEENDDRSSEDLGRLDDDSEEETPNGNHDSLSVDGYSAEESNSSNGALQSPGSLAKADYLVNEHSFEGENENDHALHGHENFSLGEYNEEGSENQSQDSREHNEEGSENQSQDSSNNAAIHSSNDHEHQSIISSESLSRFDEVGKQNDDFEAEHGTKAGKDLDDSHASECCSEHDDKLSLGSSNSHRVDNEEVDNLEHYAGHSNDFDDEYSNRHSDEYCDGLNVNLNAKHSNNLVTGYNNEFGNEHDGEHGVQYDIDHIGEHDHVENSEHDNSFDDEQSDEHSDQLSAGHGSEYSGEYSDDRSGEHSGRFRNKYNDEVNGTEHISGFEKGLSDEDGSKNSDKPSGKHNDGLSEENDDERNDELKEEHEEYGIERDTASEVEYNEENDDDSVLNIQSSAPLGRCDDCSDVDDSFSKNGTKGDGGPDDQAGTASVDQGDRTTNINIDTEFAVHAKDVAIAPDSQAQALSPVSNTSSKVRSDGGEEFESHIQAENSSTSSPLNNSAVSPSVLSKASEISSMDSKAGHPIISEDTFFAGENMGNADATGGSSKKPYSGAFEDDNSLAEASPNFHKDEAVSEKLSEENFESPRSHHSNQNSEQDISSPGANSDDKAFVGSPLAVSEQASSPSNKDYSCSSETSGAEEAELSSDIEKTSDYVLEDRAVSLDLNGNNIEASRSIASSPGEKSLGATSCSSKLGDRGLDSVVKETGDAASQFDAASPASHLSSSSVLRSSSAKSPESKISASPVSSAQSQFSSAEHQSSGRSAHDASESPPESPAIVKPIPLAMPSPLTHLPPGKAEAFGMQASTTPATPASYPGSAYSPSDHGDQDDKSLSYSSPSQSPRTPHKMNLAGDDEDYEEFQNLNETEQEGKGEEVGFEEDQAKPDDNLSQTQSGARLAQLSASIEANVDATPPSSSSSRLERYKPSSIQTGRSKIMSTPRSSEEEAHSPFSMGGDSKGPLTSLDLVAADDVASIASSAAARSPLEDMLSAEHEARAHRRRDKSFIPKPQIAASPLRDLSFGFLSQPRLSPQSSRSNLSFSSSKGDGDSMAQKEIIAAVKSAVESTHSKLYDAFLIMDNTKKGYLSRDELFRGLLNLGIGLDTATLKRFTKSVDLNGDGVITFQEFFNVFETTRVNPSKQYWSPPEATKGSFFAMADDDWLVDRDLEPRTSSTLGSSAASISSITREQPKAGSSSGVTKEVPKIGTPTLSTTNSNAVDDDDDDDDNFDLVATWTQRQQGGKRKSDLRRAPSREVALLSILRVTVHQADLGSRCDACVRCSVGGETFRTDLAESVTNPIWDEVFVFGAHEEGLPENGRLQVRLQCDRDAGPQEWDLPFWELLHFEPSTVTLNGDEITFRRWFTGPRHKLELSIVLSMDKIDDVRRLAALQTGPVDPAALWLNKATTAEPLSFADTTADMPLSPGAFSPAPGSPGFHQSREPLFSSPPSPIRGDDDSLQVLREQVAEAKLEAKKESRLRESVECKMTELEKAKQDLEKQRARDIERYEYQAREQQAREDDLRSEMQLLQMRRDASAEADDRVTRLEQSIRELKHELQEKATESGAATAAAVAARSEREDWKARVEELQVQLKQSQDKFRKVMNDSGSNLGGTNAPLNADKLTESPGEAFINAAEVDRLLQTISQLNRVIDELREAERSAQTQLRASELRVREQTADVGKLAAENESQARELASQKEEATQLAADLKQTVAAKVRLERQTQVLQDDLEHAESEGASARDALKVSHERIAQLEGQVQLVQDQLTTANERFLQRSSEVAELRKHHAANEARSQSRSPPRQVKPYIARHRPSARILGVHAKGDLKELRQGLQDIANQVTLMKDLTTDAVTQWRLYSQKLRSKRQNFAPVARHELQAKSSLSNVAMNRKLELERLRRRNLHKSRMGFGDKRVRRICSVFENSAPSDGLSSDTRGQNDTMTNMLRVEPILASAEVMVESDTSKRYFGYDEVVYIKDAAPSGADVLASDPLLGNQNGIRAQVAPIVDALFDGDRAVVISSGPASSATTNSILNAVFDVVENLAHGYKGEEKGDIASILPRVNLSCVHVQGSHVYDLLSDDHSSGGATLEEFPRLQFDQVSARATGRVDLEAAGLNIVNVKTRYEAALIASVGSGNHHTALGPSSFGSRSSSRGNKPSRGQNTLQRETALLLYTVWIDPGDAYSQDEDSLHGKMHIVEVASASRVNFADETMEALVQIINSMARRQDLDAEGSEASPGTLMRLFNNVTLLGILRDCLDEETLGIAARSRSFPNNASVMENFGRDACMFHLLIHPSLTVRNPKSAELLTALHFAQRLRHTMLVAPGEDSAATAHSPVPTGFLALRSPDEGPPPQVHSASRHQRKPEYSGKTRRLGLVIGRDEDDEDLDEEGDMDLYEPPHSMHSRNQADEERHVVDFNNGHKNINFEDEDEDEDGFNQVYNYDEDEDDENEVEVVSLVFRNEAQTKEPYLAREKDQVRRVKRHSSPKKSSKRRSSKTRSFENEDHLLDPDLEAKYLNALNLVDSIDLRDQFEALRNAVPRSVPRRGSFSAAKPVKATSRMVSDISGMPTTATKRRPSSAGRVSRSIATEPRRKPSRRRANSGASGSPGERAQARYRVLEALMGQTEGMLHTLFLSMDTRKTGVLTRSDFRRGMHKLDPTLSRRDLELFMDSMDSKRDGYIDFQEFFRVLGDAKTGNQHQIFLSNRRAYQIAMRERRKIREQLSPEGRASNWFSRESMTQEAASRINTTEEEIKELLGYKPPIQLDKILRR